ncbi:hypothetical protein [Photobacterium angustum]|uniref:Uncharacterized protein n=1 Tax=Photobacterium angustum TaxID=661 RepID=A0A855SKZ5_PHOAN|nr:hypothetical protein [Photobacterium angustum]KJG42783.1 hypothetical protein UA35_02055 [Photobacterium angustum]KJG50081.1 hypothetical protein UA30_06175 [Photobacterium angustum]PSX08800.1 hypothetical protein C0W41_06885 [Photobacterium angustum]PSX14415.1 hypothetical protein C0W55_11425 [Photobacterium angustum]PSX22610.1 hypothetical protein C0W36_15515 [Photobacterium angustum]
MKPLFSFKTCYKQLCLPIFLFSIIPSISQAEPVSDTSTDPDNQSSMADWVDDSHQSLTDTVHDIGEYLDESLAKDEDEGALTNRSYLRIRNRLAYSYRGKLDNDFKVYFKLDLPHVKRDWKLIIDSEPGDFDSLENKQRGIATGNKTTSGDTVGAFRLQDAHFGNWNSDFDIGIKLKLPLDPFTKMRFTRVDPISENWTTQLEQQVFYYHSKGLGYLSALSGYYAINPEHSKIFKTTTSAQYLKEDDKWELLQQFELFHRYDDKNLFEYSTGISADTGENKEVTNYWVSAKWNKRIYKHWLYLGVRPQLEFPREYNYHANPGVMIELEMFFSKKRKIDRLGRYIPKPTLPEPQD